MNYHTNQKNLQSIYKNWRYSTQNKAPNSPFQIGDSLRYTNQGHNEILDLADLNTNNPDRIKYINKFLRVNTIIITKDLLKSRNVPDIGKIPISSEDYITKSNNLTREQIENIMFP